MLCFMTKQEFKDMFSARLITEMRLNGITQASLARRIGISQQTISKYVDGIAIPSLSVLYDISDVFDGNLIDLIHQRVELDKRENCPTQPNTEAEYIEIFSRNLRRELSASGMSISELANKAYITRQSISRYLNGRSMPTLQAVINLHIALGCMEYELAPIRYFNI